MKQARLQMLLSRLQDPARTTPPPNANRCRELAAQMRSALAGSIVDAQRALRSAEDAFDDLARMLEVIEGLVR
jgi:hypothetical protein